MLHPKIPQESTSAIPHPLNNHPSSSCQHKIATPCSEKAAAKRTGAATGSNATSDERKASKRTKSEGLSQVHHLDPIADNPNVGAVVVLNFIVNDPLQVFGRLA